jgi:hypothetical protein
MRSACVLSTLLLAVLAHSSHGARYGNFERPDAPLFRQADLRADAKSLLAFLRGFCPTAAQRERLPLLIRRLDDDDPDVREAAEADLCKMGPAAAGAMQRAMKGAETGKRRILRRCLAKMGASYDPEVHEAAARRLAELGGEDAVPLLLAYLPEAPDDGARDAASAALASLHHKRKEAAAVVEALKDDHPARRAAAARALAAGQAARHLDALKALVKDADPEVRLQAASALVRAGDKVGVPALVALLEKAPLPVAWRAERLLGRIAGAKSPPVALQGTQASRAACHVAWAKWHKGAEAKLDLAALPPPRWPYLAYTDLSEGWLVALDAAWKESWRIEGLSGPTDAQLLPSGRVLIAENWAGKLTERDEKGKVFWECKPANYPISCWRLDSGNTVVVSRKDVCELTPDGKAVWAKARARQIFFARPLRDGGIALKTEEGLVLLGPTGGEVACWLLPGFLRAGPFSVLPGGRYLGGDGSHVTEYDSQGRDVSWFRCDGGVDPIRLDNGHTIAYDDGKGKRLVEFDRTGKVVRGEKVEGDVWRLVLVPR